MATALTEQQREAIAEAFRAGAACNAIARQYHITTEFARKLRLQAGLPPNHHTLTREPPTPEQIAERAAACRSAHYLAKYGADGARGGRRNGDKNGADSLTTRQKLRIWFLRETYGATLEMIADEMGVWVKTVARVLREPKPPPPRNRINPCPVCGRKRDGLVCRECQARELRAHATGKVV